TVVDPLRRDHLDPRGVLDRDDGLRARAHMAHRSRAVVRELRARDDLLNALDIAVLSVVEAKAHARERTRLAFERRRIGDPDPHERFPVLTGVEGSERTAERPRRAVGRTLSVGANAVSPEDLDAGRGDDLDEGMI